MGIEIKKGLKFLLSEAAMKISALPYYVLGMIDYHFNPNALKQSEIEPFIDNEKINARVLRWTFICPR